MSVPVKVSGPLQMPGKPGDVGHDLMAIITPSKQTRIERFLSPDQRVFAGLPMTRLGKLRHRLTQFIHKGRNVQIIWPFQIKAIGSHVHIVLPNSLWALVTARSSASKRRLLVIGGIIDSGYRGEYYTVFLNVSLLPCLIRAGERYSQVIFHNSVRPHVQWGSLTAEDMTARGGTGFGSTGR